MSAKSALKRINEKCKKAKKRIDNIPDLKDGVKHPSLDYRFNYKGGLNNIWITKD